MRITARRANRAFAAGVLATAMVTALASQALAAPLADGPYAGREVISSGHVDLLHLSTPAGGTIGADIHSDDLGTLTPETVVVQGKPSLATRTVSNATAALPGWPAAGGTYYLLPQTNQAGQVFAGFGYDTTTVPTGTSVTWALTNVSGPGAFAMWQTDDPNVVFLGSDASAPKSFTSTANHEHVNWGFTATGSYEVTFTPTYTVPNGAPVTLPAKVYHFYIGEDIPTNPIVVPPTDPIAVTVAGWPSGAHAHYHTGQTGVLTANVTPAADTYTYQWYTKAPGATDWTAVSGAKKATYGFIVATSDAGREIKVKVTDAAGNAVESASGTVAIDDHGNEFLTGPIMSAQLKSSTAGLTLSIPDDKKTIAMTAFQMGANADRYTSTGSLTDVTVTDARVTDAGWTASAMVRGFVTQDGKTLTGKALGWTPAVASASVGQNVTAGPAVATEISGGTGLGSPWKVLASGAVGSGKGTAVLGADLLLEAPTTLQPGTYQGMMIFTLI